MCRNKVCIVGAGISGLVSAKVFTQAGFDVTVFEQKLSIGGVWEESRTYPGLTTQTPGSLYAFSDYPMPDNYPEWPSATQVRDYLESYAKKFGIHKLIKFQTKITSIKSDSSNDKQWIIQTINQHQKAYSYIFDFVIICNGTSCTPNIPVIEGSDNFIGSGGAIIHSTQFNDPSLVKEKKVLVVGFGKSATDIANLVADLAQKTVLIFRNPSWKTPRYFLNMVNSKYLFASRFSEMFFPYYRMNTFEKIMHTIAKPLIWLFWRINERTLRLQLKLDMAKMLPLEPIEKSLTCSTGTVSEGFYEKVISKLINARKAKISHFFSKGVELDNGEKIEVDVVIFGTGFKKNLSFLENKYSQMVLKNNHDLYLYRNIVHPQIPNLGFIGYNSSFFSMLTSEMGARWLLEYFQNSLDLPSVEDMLLEIEVQRRWIQDMKLNVFNDAGCVAPFSLHYIEQLMEDMKLSRQSNIWQKLKNFFMPVDPSSYKSEYLKKAVK